MMPTEILHRFEKSLEYTNGSHTWEDVREGLLTGKYQIFHNDNGACVTEIVQAPKCRYLHLWLVAGEMPGVLDLLPQMEKYASAQTCKFMVASGRPGWAKELKKLGWGDPTVMVTKDVQHA